MNAFLALLWARNKEFYRDKASMVWALVLPVLIVMTIALSFSNEGQRLFKVGVLVSTDAMQPAVPQGLSQPYVTIVPVKDAVRGITRVRHHQFDLLLEQQGQQWRYWINPHADKGIVAERLLRESDPNAVREAVSGRALRYIDWVMPGVLGMNIMFGGLFGAGYVIVRYRKMGVLKRLQATPVTAFQFLAAQLCSRWLIVVVASVAIFMGCHFFLDFLVLGSGWLLLLIAGTGALAMIALGLVMSSRTDSEELAGGLLNVLTYPMLLLSEVWFSLDDAPAWMQSAAQLLPLTHMLAAAREVMLEGAGMWDVLHHLVVLLAISTVSLLVAAGLFRWGKA